MRWLRMVFLLGAVGGVPFALWRYPMPDGEPVVFVGEVAYDVLDHPSDIRHQLRTPFEELLGNRALTLIDGPRLYVSQLDYDRCWTDIGTLGPGESYTMLITAKAKPLYFNDYTVARIIGIQRIDRPMVRAR